MVDHKKNRGTEKRALQYLKRELKGFYVPTKEEKKRILQLMGISRRFAQAFDGVVLKRVSSFAKVQSTADFDLIETKTTDKYLPHNPKGFFFGMTENEEMLLKVFEGKYFLCFVSLHPDSTTHALLDWTQLKKITANRRVQYQINMSKA